MRPSHDRTEGSGTSPLLDRALPGVARPRRVLAHPRLGPGDAGTGAGRDRTKRDRPDRTAAEHDMNQPNRREVLKWSAALAASTFLPHGLFADETKPRKILFFTKASHFIHDGIKPSGD